MLGWITDIPSVLTATVGRSVGITYDKAMFGGGLVEVVYGLCLPVLSNIREYRL